MLPTDRMRIFTADNETVLTFAGTLFTIETARAFVSYPPFSLASPAIPRLAHQGKSPDRPSPIALIASPRLPPPPARRLRAIIRRYYFILARLSLASRSNRVARAYPSVALFQFPETGAPTDLGVIVAPKPPSRIADRTATLALRRIAFEDIFFLSSLARGRRTFAFVRGGECGRRAPRSRAGRKRSARSVVVDPLGVDRDRPILDGSRLENTSHRPRLARSRRRARARRRRVGSSTAIDRASAPRDRVVRSFVRSFVRSREVVVARRPVVAVVARGREGGRARGTARAREREKGVDAGGGRR